MHDILISHVRSKCLPCVPPTADWLALRDIYFDKLDPLYPVISHAVAQNDELSPSTVIVKQVICLAAATNPDALPHLRLLPYGNLLSRSEFTASLAAAVHATIESGLITDRVLLIRILLLYAMYMQPTCLEEADLPTLIFSRAAHQLFTLGLHLPISEADDDFDQIQSLFCCTWALDRLNAAFYGRACIIHERDVGWDLDVCIQSQSPPFRLFLSVTRLLDSVIGLYRPSQKLTEEPLFIDLPIMEQMIIDAGATKVASPLLGEYSAKKLPPCEDKRVQVGLLTRSKHPIATIEIFYHAVAILSCRFPQGGSSQSALPSRATNSRRSLSADRITELFRDEFPGQLSYVPTIPYAVSLSLSVGYRKMRYSQISMFRKRGKRAFAANTALLKDLGEMFWCARTMAGMAEQVLQEMNKAAATIAQENSNENGNGNGNGGVLGREDSNGSSQLGGEDNSTNMAAETPRPMPRAGGLPMSSLPLDNGNGDMPIFASPPEIDVWGHLDPNFNLGAIDAAIQGNLDFGTSSNWFDWQQSWGFVE